MIFSLLNKSLNDFKLREKEKASISQKYPLNLPVVDLEDSSRDIASVNLQSLLIYLMLSRYKIIFELGQGGCKIFAGDN